jgi:large subunit ribosomal protein L9
MAAIELILLQRVPKLGQMGERVRVKPGYARNFLLPQKKALRATKENAARFEHERVVLEAQNIERREEAERVAERARGLAVTLIRQAGDSGSLYGSVSSRDISDGATAGGLKIDRGQVELDHPIKTLGVRQVRVVLHPEVVMLVARSTEEAEKQLRGEAVGRAAGEEPEPTAAELFGTDEDTEAA